MLTCTFICICKIFSHGMLLCKIFEEFNNAKIKLSWKIPALWCIIKVVQLKICTKYRYKCKALASGDFFKWANTATTVVRPFQNPCIYNWGPYRAIVWFQVEIYWIVQTSCSVKIYLLITNEVLSSKHFFEKWQNGTGMRKLTDLLAIFNIFYLLQNWENWPSSGSDI